MNLALKPDDSDRYRVSRCQTLLTDLAESPTTTLLWILCGAIRTALGVQVMGTTIPSKDNSVQ